MTDSRRRNGDSTAKIWNRKGRREASGVKAVANEITKDESLFEIRVCEIDRPVGYPASIPAGLKFKGMVLDSA